MKYDFYKNKETDTIFWVDNFDNVGEYLFLSTRRKYTTFLPTIRIT